MKKVQFVSVRFDASGNSYTYTAPALLKIAPKDVVVVKANGKLKLVQVVRVEQDYTGSFPESGLKPIHAVLDKV